MLPKILFTALCMLPSTARAEAPFPTEPHEWVHQHDAWSEEHKAWADDHARWSADRTRLQALVKALKEGIARENQELRDHAEEIRIHEKGIRYHRHMLAAHHITNEVRKGHYGGKNFHEALQAAHEQRAHQHAKLMEAAKEMERALNEDPPLASR